MIKRNRTVRKKKKRNGFEIFEKKEANRNFLREITNADFAAEKKWMILM